MFTTDAFGQRVLCSPRLSFMASKADPAGGGGGGGAGDDSSVELDGEKFNFPAKTAVKDMTPEQASEYWRHEAKKQQGKAKSAKPTDYDQLKKDSEDLAALRAASTPKEQREEQERLDEARRDGENIGAAKYLRPAIEGRFQALTGLDEETTAKIFAHVDVQTFVDDAGEIDVEAIQEYASTHGSAGNGSQGRVPDPVRESVTRQRPAGGGGGGQSMQERREAARERMAPKSKTTTQ